MQKSPEAFRTISEVADWLGVPTHVLRFWESRFTQVKPVKRAGGRRYYRPADMMLLGGIKRLLHDDGMTIRGVQKLLREEGVKHVAGFSQPLDSDDMIDVTPEDDAAEVPASPIALDVEPEPVDNVVPIKAEEPDAEPASEDDAVPELAFLRRGADPEPQAPATEAADESTSPQADLFTSRRRAPEPAPAEPEPEVAAGPRIPPTPDVPDTDPADDDASFAATPGPALRLRALRTSGRRPDPAIAAEARDRVARLLETA